MSSKPNDDVNALCSALDSMYIDICELVEHIKELRMASNALLSQGYFSIMEARMDETQGISADIGTTAYSGRQIQPTAVLAAEPRTSGSKKDEEDSLPPLSLTSLAQSTPSNSSSGGHLVRRRLLTAHLKYSRMGEMTAPAANAAEAAKLDEPGEEDLSTQPLRWFGILAPPQLHDAQANFRQALAMLVELVNAERELRSLEAKYTRMYSSAHPTKAADKASSSSSSAPRAAKAVVVE